MISTKVLTLVASLLLLSCMHSTASRGVQATIAVDRAMYHLGDTAHVTVTASNRGREVVKITTNRCPSVFEVIDSRDSVQMPGRQICLASLEQRNLTPGESYVFGYRWPLIGRAGVALPPGQYRIRGRVYGQGFRAETSLVSVEIMSK